MILFLYLMVKPTCNVVYLLSTLRFSHASLRHLQTYFETSVKERSPTGACPEVEFSLKSINATCFVMTVICTLLEKSKFTRTGLSPLLLLNDDNFGP